MHKKASLKYNLVLLLLPRYSNSCIDVPRTLVPYVDRMASKMMSWVGRCMLS